jgi:hypothetical protein
MVATSRRLRREYRTMARMVEIHCAAHHDGPAPCASCQAFLEYAGKRLDKCPYGAAKPVCAKCPIHCYKKAPRALAREIMRDAGPRMAVKHPLLSLAHLFDKLRRVEHPMRLRASRRSRSGYPPSR